MLLLNSALASRPACVASRVHTDTACGFKSFDELLCAVGDLQDESGAEEAQVNRFATLGELTRMASTHGGAHARQHRHASQCSAVPEPVWTVEDSGKSIRLRDETSRFALRSPVDVTSAPHAVRSMLSEQRRWINDMLQSGGALRGRWIYFMGDSTMRQDYAYLLNALRRQVRQQHGQETHTSPLSFDRMKAVARGQLRFDEGSNASTSMCHSLQQPSDWEYHYPGPVYGVNEMTTTFRLHDANLTLTFDWKMHVFRRYDRWLLSRRFARAAPDVLVVSAGLHDCFWNESRALGPEYHKEQVRAYLAFLAAHLPASTELLWASAQVSIGPLSGGKLPLLRATDDNALRLRSRLFSDGSPSAHLRCVQAVNHAAAAASRDEGWFVYVDRERVTHALASFAVHGHPPNSTGGRAGGGSSSFGPSWLPHGSGTTANARASLLTKDGVHYSEDSSVLATLNHYLRSALGCVLSRSDGKHHVPAV